MDSIVQTMMQQLLSKEILHEPMKDIVEKYPKWLEDNKDKISKEEYERYNNQLELMVKLIEVYENDPENMTKIFDIMQNMQECGQPPSDLVQDIVPDLDLSKLGQLSPEMLESAPNCCVMWWMKNSILDANSMEFFFSFFFFTFTSPLLASVAWR